MVATVLDFFFGCSHTRLSFPITVRSSQRRSAAAEVTGTYRVCLDCGQEFAYDWQEMRVVREPHSRSHGIRQAVEFSPGD